MTKHETSWAAVQADPAYQSAIAAVNVARLTATTARIDALGAIRTIQSLMLAASAASDRMARIADASEEDCATLSAFTGDSSECWSNAFSDAEDCAQDAAMLATLSAASAVRRWHAAKRGAEAASLAVKLAADAARAAWSEGQS